MAGRPKGSTGRQNKAIKDMIEAALDEVGGKQYFVEQAKENPSAFMTLVGRILPKDISLTRELHVITYKPTNEDVEILQNVTGQTLVIEHDPQVVS